jgi:hypothetical protein
MFKSLCVFVFPFFVLAMAMTSCGYRAGSGKLSDDYSTLTVPYIQGDNTGLLTSALIREVGVSSPFRYVNCDGDLCLDVRLVGFREENVGFRYDLQRDGKRAPWIIPDETRLSVAVEVKVLDHECIVLGPVRLTAAVDFDHEYYLSPNGVNVFSLGQLTDVREAREAANTPLAEAIAKKVVDYISNAW